MKNLKAFNDLMGNSDIMYKEFGDDDTIDVVFKNSKERNLHVLETKLSNRLKYIFSHLEQYPEFKKYEYLYKEMIVFTLSTTYEPGYATTLQEFQNMKREYTLECYFSDGVYESKDVSYGVMFTVNVDTLHYEVYVDIEYTDEGYMEDKNIDKGILPTNKIIDLFLIMFKYCEDIYKMFS
jgi:hypothetical protein